MMERMSNAESFSVKTGEHVVRAAIHMPETPAGAEGYAGVLICMGLSCARSEELHDAWQAELVRSLNDCDLAAVTFQPHCADKLLEEFHEYSADDDAADAMTVFDGLCTGGTLSAQRLGVFGSTLGALQAMSIAHRSQHARRLCLMCPASVEMVNTEMREGDDGGGRRVFRRSLLPRRYRQTVAAVYGSASSASWKGDAMILSAAGDRDFPVEDAEAHARTISDWGAGGRSSLAIIPFATHQMREAQQRAFACEQIARFFEPLTDAA
jgi:hypothetical protein